MAVGEVVLCKFCPHTLMHHKILNSCPTNNCPYYKFENWGLCLSMYCTQ